MGVFTKFKVALNRFHSDQRGSMAILVAFTAVPLIVAGGAAIDLERALNARTALRASLDSAALYAATLSDTSNSTLTSKAQAYMSANYLNNADATLSDFAIVNNGSTVTASAKVSLTTAFMGLVGINNITVGSVTTVVKQGFNLEVALVLDNTGSMGFVNPVTGNTAEQDAISAANLFVQMVPPQNSGQTYTKIAAIPYNNSVNLGTTAYANYARGPIASGTSTTPGYSIYRFNSYTGDPQAYSYASNIGTCVTERQGAQAYTDVSPYNSSGVLVAPFGRFYGPTGYNGCTVTAMVPLQVTAAPLTAAINAMSAGGSTAGQVGIAWGWYALSPGVGIWSGTSSPASYSVTVGSPSYVSTTPNINQVHKVMILMTDGEYNSAYAPDGVISAPSSLSGSGASYYQSPASSPLGNSYTQAMSMCGAIKTSGIEVYVVTFQYKPQIVQRANLVNACATDAAHIIDADTTSPSAAFAKIANQLNAMRIQS